MSKLKQIIDFSAYTKLLTLVFLDVYEISWYFSFYVLTFFCSILPLSVC